MLSKKVIKDIQSLGLKKHREETGLFIAEGPKIVAELRQIIPGHIQQILALEEWDGNDDTNVIRITAAELEKISQLKTPNQVVAVVKQFEERLPVLDGLVLYLDAIQDPGNFGTIIRTADWFGLEHIVCSSGCAELYNPKVVQATMASIARVNVYYDKADEWLYKQNVTRYAASLHGQPLSAFSKIHAGVLIIGNESKGIREEFMSLADEKITISRRGGAESLNAAVATGIILSHMVG
jgi:TrmH family RNA methyltransferase